MIWLCVALLCLRLLMPRFPLVGGYLCPRWWRAYRMVTRRNAWCARRRVVLEWLYAMVKDPDSDRLMRTWAVVHALAQLDRAPPPMPPVEWMR